MAAGLGGLLLALSAWTGLAQPGGPSPVGILAGPITNPANNHQYYLLEPACWTNAENTAVSLGGHLVSIDDEAENSWVCGAFSSFGGVDRELWIGFCDPAPTADGHDWMARLQEYGWVSGHPVTVTLWAYPLPWDTNNIPWGFCKLCNPNDPQPGRAGRWTDESPTALLSGVVELPGALEIVSQPKNISVGIGVDARFSILAEGSTPLQYQWRAGGNDLPGETKATLVIPDAQPAQSGPFSVVVTNASGALTSSTAWLAVGGIVTWGATSSFDTRNQVPPGLASVLAIAAGERHDLALKPDGTVAAWGENLYGQLNVPVGLTNVVALAAGLYHSLALKADGTVVAWGYDPHRGAWVPDDLTNVVAIAAHGFGSLALRTDSTVVAWGDGDGARPTAPAPAGLSNVVAIAAGGEQNLALKADGTLVAWDYVTGAWLPVPPEVTNVVAISAGESHDLALRADGTVVAWGDDSLGQADVPGGLRDVVAIAAGLFHSLALKNDGTVVAWGSGYDGEINVPPSLPDVVAIAAGDGHSLALLRDGAPNLTLQPRDLLAGQGGSPCFVAKAVGLQAMRYQWRFNGKDIAGATNDAYSVVNAQPADAGLYSVAIANPVGTSMSRLAKLIISCATPTPTDLYVVNPGQNLCFTNFPAMIDPARQYTFSLLAGPSDATLTADTGVFTWRPAVAMAGTTNLLRVRITDNMQPPDTETRGVTVVVNPLTPVQLQPRLTANGWLAFQVTGIAGPDYIVEASSDLFHWTILQTSAPDVLPFVFTEPAANPNRFYRIRLGP